MSTLEDALALSRARELGAQAGRDAASWVFDGNTSTETYQRALKLLNEGDPAIEHFIMEPHWLGGLYDYPTPASLGQELGVDHVFDPYLLDRCCTAYEDAAREKFWTDVEAFAQRMVEDWT